MSLQHTLTAEFTEAVDALMRDADIPDSALYSRAQRSLEVFNEAIGTGQVKRWPAWAERIHKASSHPEPSFSTPNLFNIMYEVADELGLVAGKRYVSAAICVQCADHLARRAGEAADPDREQRAADLAQALHQLSSTWAAFLLWPFYAYANELRDREEDDRPVTSGDETPTAESEARAHRHRWKKQVMARDDYRCFMSGGLDARAYDAGRSVPPGAQVRFCYTVPIIPPEVWTRGALTSQDGEVQSDPATGDPYPHLSQHSPSEHRQKITLGILKRFCAVDDAALVEKTGAGPPNRLFVSDSAENAFRKLQWCLHPTETPDRYEIRSYMPSCFVGCGHVTSHVTFVDHSESGVDLPDRELLRTHAALTGVLQRSGADDIFGYLRLYVPWLYRGRSVYPASTGCAFWKSVVAYEGPEVCLEVELWEASEALRDSISGAGPHAPQ